MKLTIYACGKLKDAGIERMVADYCRRSRTFLPVELRPIRNMKALRELMTGCVVVLDERGEHLTSEALAQACGSRREKGVREIGFFIGDAYGFTDSDREAADFVLALSKLTLPHRLAQLLLVEQLYRVGTILAGHPYHHEG